MWIIRLLMFLMEYGGVFLLSIAGALVTYLLNLRRADLAKHSGFTEIFLRNWLELRKRWERKSRWLGFVTLGLTVIAATTFLPLISLAIIKLKSLWSTIITGHPGTPAVIVGSLLIVLPALLLFLLRRASLRAYGSLEIIVGLFLAFGALGLTDQVTPSGTQLAQKLVSLEVLKFMTAVYVIIRGLVNLTERQPTPTNDHEAVQNSPA